MPSSTPKIAILWDGSGIYMTGDLGHQREAATRDVLVDLGIPDTQEHNGRKVMDWDGSPGDVHILRATTNGTLSAPAQQQDPLHVVLRTGGGVPAIERSRNQGK